MLYATLIIIAISKWTWVLFADKAIFTFTILTTLALAGNTKRPYFTILLLLILTALYINTTQKTSPTFLTPLQKDLQSKRLNSYPSPPVPILPGPIAYKFPHFLEQKSQTLALYKTQNNLRNIFDPNYYFFGSYPLELQTPGEFSKFPFFLFPLFLYGLVKQKLNKILIIYIFIVFSTVALIGDQNHLGIFIAYPLITLTIAQGLTKK